jgi:hypothetical protein
MKTTTKLVRLHLSQIGQAKPGDDGTRNRFNSERREFENKESALEWLEIHYGITPPKRLTDGNSVFVDRAGGTVQRVGFISRRWVEEYDRSRTTPKHYWEENWVTFAEVEEVVSSEDFSL